MERKKKKPNEERAVHRNEREKKLTKRLFVAVFLKPNMKLLGYCE